MSSYCFGLISVEFSPLKLVSVLFFSLQGRSLKTIFIHFLNFSICWPLVSCDEIHTITATHLHLIWFVFNIQVSAAWDFSPKLVTCSDISLVFHWFFLGVERLLFSFGLTVASSLSAELLHTAKIKKDNSFSHEFCLPYEDCIDSAMALF